MQSKSDTRITNKPRIKTYIHSPKCREESASDLFFVLYSHQAVENIVSALNQLSQNCTEVFKRDVSTSLACFSTVQFVDYHVSSASKNTNRTFQHMAQKSARCYSGHKLRCKEILNWKFDSAKKLMV